MSIGKVVGSYAEHKLCTEQEKEKEECTLVHQKFQLNK